MCTASPAARVISVVGPVPGRAGEPELEARERRGLHQRVRDVVAVAHVGDLEALEAAEALAKGQQVGQRLARVVVVGERVDHGHRGRLGHLLHVALRERPDDDRGAVGGHDARRVGDRLAAAELQLVRAQHDRQGAEPVDRGLDRYTRARGRLREVTRDGLARQRVEPAPRVRLHLGRERQERLEPAGREVRDAEEVVLRGGGDGGHSSSLSIGQDMQRGPPRPRPSSKPAIVMTSIPSRRSSVLVSTLRS